MSDTADDGITVTHGASWTGGGDDEISDAEAQFYDYRLNGIRVQSYWSRADGTYIVPDGNAQDFVYTPNFDSSNTYLGTGTLTVLGDQFGAGYNDVVSVERAFDGGVLVTLNGETAHFDPGKITSITVDTFGGDDTINIEQTLFNVPVNVNPGDGNDTVNIAPTGKTLDGIQGAVSVAGSQTTTLNIEDSGNFSPSGGLYSISSSSISRAGAASIGYSGPGQVNIFGSSGNDVFNVSSTVRGTSTSLYGENGNNTFNISSTSHNLSDIQGNVQAVGGFGFGSDTVVVNDQANAGATTYSVGSTSLTRAGAAQVGYAADESVVLNGGSAADVYNVEGTPSGTTLAIEGGAANDSFNVSPTAQNLVNIQGALNLVGNGGVDAVVVHDESNATASTYSVLSASVARSGSATIGDSTDESLTLDGGSAADTYAIAGAASGASTAVENLNGGAANDVFRFADAAGVTGTVNGGGGVNTLDYSAYRTGVSVNLTAGTATGTGGVLNIQNVTGSTAADHLTGSAAANVLVANGGIDVLVGGGGTDTFVLANAQATATTVSGGGAATLVGGNVARLWALTGLGAGTVNGIAFTGIANLTGGSYTDTFQLGARGGLTGKVDGGGGVNTLDYTGRTTPVTVNLATSTATAMAGFLNIQIVYGGGASDTLVGPNLANTWTIVGANSGKIGAWSFFNFENLTGGTATDAFRFAPSGSVAGKVNGGAITLNGGGVNTLDYTSAGAPATVNPTAGTATRTGGFLNIQALIGSAGAGDQLIGPSTASTWTITALNSGKLNGTFSFTGVENLTGGAGLDTFQFADKTSVSGRIDGGGGGDWLDYSAYVTGVVVNLAAGTATGAAGGIANIRNVIGGTGADTLTGNALGNVLVGGAGADTITAGAGRSVLIGGTGVDHVGGGLADDLVIGDSTSFDHNAAALASILAEWQSAGSYAQRINHLRLGGGLNGTNELVFGVTVTDDHAADVLTGGAGSDWFFEDGLDTITDLSASELIN
jgi:hypothetical protein